MTSNHADRLDKALVRPGRIDRMISLSNISQRSAELMFLRMYAPDHTHESAAPDVTFELGDGELEKLALEFSSQIPENTFTPAQLQGYLLNRRASPKAAAVEASVWVEEEKATMEDTKARAKEAKAWRAKQRKGASMRLLSRNLATAGLDDDLAQELADLGVEIGVDRAATLRAAINGRSKEDVKDEAEATAKMEASGESKERVPVEAKEEKIREVENKMSGDLKEATPGEVEQDTRVMPKPEINGETKEVLATAREETNSEAKDEVPSIAGDGLAETSKERIENAAGIETQDS
jgi:chaperone BCS1